MTSAVLRISIYICTQTIEARPGPVSHTKDPGMSSPSGLLPGISSLSLQYPVFLNSQLLRIFDFKFKKSESCSSLYPIIPPLPLRVLFFSTTTCVIWTLSIPNSVNKNNILGCLQITHLVMQSRFNKNCWSEDRVQASVWGMVIKLTSTQGCNQPAIFGIIPSEFT